MNKKQNVILITDPNSDPDDLASFIILSHLAEQEKLKLSAVITTAGCKDVRLKRAKFAQGAFNELGMKNIKTAAGIDYPVIDEAHENNYCENKYESCLSLQSSKIEENALSIMVDILENAENKTVTLLVNAPMADAGNLVSCAEALCVEKLKQIVIMGGAEADADEAGIYLPNNKSYNNKVCFAASKQVFEFAQKHNIRLVLVPKETVYQVQVTKEFYETLGASENPIAQSMYLANRKFIEFLWNSVKNGNYSHFDVKRFLKVFMGDEYHIRSRKVGAKSSFADIWDNIRYFNLYDALTVLAAFEDEFEGGYYEQLRNGKNIFVAKISDADMLRNILYNTILKKLGC